MSADRACPKCTYRPRDTCRQHAPDSERCLKRQRRNSRNGSLAADDVLYRNAQQQGVRDAPVYQTAAAGISEKNRVLAGTRMLQINKSQRVLPSRKRLGEYVCRDGPGMYDKTCAGEMQSYDQFFALVRPGWITIDVGANIGMVSVELALRGALVHAYEPHPENARRLRNHVQLNNVSDKVSFYQTAVVGDGRSKTKLYIADGNCAAHSTLEIKGRRAIDVAATSASRVFHAAVDAVKLDAEGAEYKIMSYLRLCTGLKLICAELHFNRKELRVRAIEFVSILSEMGFVAVRAPDLVNVKLRHTVGIWQRVPCLISPRIAVALAEQSVLPPSSGTCFQTFVISLATQQGFHRRASIGFNTFRLHPGVVPAHVPPNIQRLWPPAQRYSKSTWRKLMCAFSAHFTLWQRVKHMDVTGVIVLEDDAKLIRAVPNIDFPDDAITLLGGVLRTPGLWDREASEFVKPGAIGNVLASLRPGVNEMPHLLTTTGSTIVVKATKFTMCVAYYLPRRVAGLLLEDALSNRRRLTSPDIWMTPFVKYLLWPNAFGDQGALSQCGSPADDGSADLYASRRFQNAIRASGCALPPQGSDLPAIAAWQTQWKALRGLA